MWKGLVDVEGSVQGVSLFAECFMGGLEASKEEKGVGGGAGSGDGGFDFGDGLLDRFDLGLQGENLVEVAA